MNPLFTKPISILLVLSFFLPLASAQQATDEEIAGGATDAKRDVRSDFMQCRSMVNEGGDLGKAATSCFEACLPLWRPRGPAVSPEMATQCNVRIREFKALLPVTSTAPAPVTGPIPDVEGSLMFFDSKNGMLKVESSDPGPWTAECHSSGRVKDMGDIPTVRDPSSPKLVRLVGVQVPPTGRYGRRPRCSVDRIELINP